MRMCRLQAPGWLNETSLALQVDAEREEVGCFLSIVKNLTVFNSISSCAILCLFCLLLSPAFDVRFT
jgi:hypothetical protein